MRLELAFAASYLFDYTLTGVMLLTNDRWIDLAHFIFIPFVGVYGYLLYRAAIFPLALWVFRLVGNEPYAMLIFKVLTAFYIAVNLYNVGWLLISM